MGEPQGTPASKNHTPVLIRRIQESEHEVMSLLTARVFLDTIRVSYEGYCTPENYSARDVFSEAQECCEWLNDANGRIVTARAGDKLLGYAAYCPNASEPDEYDWSLEGFFVLPEEQGRGIGTRLLTAAVADMLDAGGVKLVVATFTGSKAERYYLGTGAKLLYVRGNDYFGKNNDVSFLGWDLKALHAHLKARLRKEAGLGDTKGLGKAGKAPAGQEGPEIAANRQAWALLAKDHYEHFRRRLSSEHNLLNRIITAELGDITGKSVIHLQCNTGADTLCLARLGAASVTGVDLVPENIRYARDLARDLGISNARFIESDVLQLTERHHERYDVVFTSEGALCWLPDLSSWAKVVRCLLNGDGFFYVFDSHPFVMALDENKVGHGITEVKYPYFSKEPDIGNTIGGYAADERPSRNYSWMYTVGDIINSLTGAGLNIEWFNEYDVLYFAEDGMVPVEKGLWASPVLRGKLPMTFSIRATVRKA